MNTTTTTTAKRCECGQVTGVPCEWDGEGDAAIIEWMPEHLRASHTAARNRGVYPHNGALRLYVSAECADLIKETDGEWTDIRRIISAACSA